MKVKAKDIAAKLGVSPATVSNALNGRDGVGDELRERILKAAQEMGYESAKASPDRKQHIRVLIMKTACGIIVDTQFFSEMFESIQSECHRAGLELIMNHIYVNETSPWESLIAEYCAEKCAGIIVLATEIDSSLLYCFDHCQSPLVALDNLFQYVPIHSVVMNNQEAGYMATKELYENGHRRIGYLSSRYEFANNQHRQLGYEMAMRDNQLADNMDIWPIRLSIEGAYEDMKAHLESGRPLPTAFFACNDSAAVGAIRAMQEKGIRIPEDVSVIGVDDTDICLACNPQLTSFHVFRRDMGRVAIQMLLNNPVQPGGSFLKVQLSVSLVRRSSVKRLAQA